MPKMKTKRGARKRLKRTGSGKLTRAGGWKQHKLEGKGPRRRRRLRKNKMVDKSDERKLQVLVPYL
jgi:large subunit ribosomal protein L35